MYGIAGEVESEPVPAETWRIPAGTRPGPSCLSDYMRLLGRFIEYGPLRFRAKDFFGPCGKNRSGKSLPGVYDLSMLK
jgi:hypothetical protein